MSPRRIVKRIFDSENPAVATQRLAPYSLYSLVLHLGLDEGSELLTMANREQIGRVFDFHCWAGSEFQEIYEQLSDIASLDEQSPTGGRQIYVVFAPLKEAVQKHQQVKAREEQLKKQAEKQVAKAVQE